MPPNISSFGGELDNLTMLITVISVVCLILAEAVLFYALVRYRKHPGGHSRYLTGEGWAQARWVLLPVLVVVALDFLIDVQNTRVWNDIKTSSAPSSGYPVRIIGQQFAWTFVHPGPDAQLDTPDDVTTVGELHVPLMYDVAFELQARDVLHSFWVPNLRLKQDALPGRTIQGWFRAEKTGTYDIACAEICGGGHSLMGARLVVSKKEDLNAWLASKSAPLGPGEKMLDAKGCLACHSTDGTKRVGPSFQGLWGRQETVLTNGVERQVAVDEAYVKHSLDDPTADVVKGFPPVMPSQAGKLNDEEFAQLIEFLKSKEKAP